ncbi:MAG: hypothetical protein CMG64_05460 [Candidatus Marinimicrobia bacterium]|nr:hypothetical protein [Candidatus Neomarinimicrobiota bacterium]
MKICLSSFIFTQNDVCFEIEANLNNNSAFSCFSKYIRVLDCFDVYAQSSIADEKILHVASVAAELLDNNEDGVVDDSILKNRLSNRGALMPIFTSDGNSCMNSFENNYNGNGVSAVLFRNEIDPNNPGQWGDDATVEEVIHTINHVGHVSIYPSAFNINPNSSEMSDAMDIARGGQFLNVPNNYPEEAWYHYDDWTCDYGCMAIEYMYWSIVSHMGILNDTQTCNGINNEWELCTPELFQNTDIAMYGLITNPIYKIPQLAPDGNYCPAGSVSGDVNGDLIVNILDVISVINIILYLSEFNVLADLNQDDTIDVLDVILIVLIIQGE